MTFDTSGWSHDQFSADHVNNILPSSTRPIYLVEINFSGTAEYLSCSGAVTYDGQAYAAGGCSVESMKNQETARLSFPATAERNAQLLNSSWRRGVCNIYFIPGAPGDTLTYAAADGVLLLPGLIDAAELSRDSIRLDVVNKYLTGVMCPGLIFNQFCNHIPAAGTSITWEGETDVLESGLVLGPGIR